ncbi:hypothetical protein CHARACLAT_018784 [Characodon lateralis]|uniref:Uncharacterized protein n=1 Tax=Characodon lateralis TaxID=208331 RepID=A0ABU7ENJ3_9TELE|nr:hypothetical protein [Characodon lateralis]
MPLFASNSALSRRFRAVLKRTIFPYTFTRSSKQKQAESARSHVARAAATPKEPEGSGSRLQPPGIWFWFWFWTVSHMVLLRHISIALTAAVAALGSALFIALNYFYKRRVWSPQAAYCTITEGKVELVPISSSHWLRGRVPGHVASPSQRHTGETVMHTHIHT